MQLAASMIVGKSSVKAGDAASHGFLYTPSGMRDLGTLGGENSAAYGINNNGQVVGSADTAAFQTHEAFISSGAGMVQLTGFYSHYDNSARAVNDSAQVVGYSAGQQVRRAFLWSAQTLTELGWGGDGGAYGINNSGQVVGGAMIQGGHIHAFLYSGSTMNDLGTLGGGDSGACAINDSGQVVGESYTATGAIHAFLYSGSTMTDLGTLGGKNSFAYNINESGEVVGQSYTVGNAARHAFLYRGNTMSDLNNLIDSGSGWTLHEAWDINDSGQIVGSGVNAFGQERAFLLTKVVPEPSTVVLACLGATLALALRWRRR